VIRLSGRIRSALVIGLQGIRARKLRTLLSMVSLFLGVLAVVVVQAAAQLAQQSLLADIELTQGKDGTVQGWIPATAATTEVTFDTLHGRDDAVAQTNLQAIIGEPGVMPINAGGGSFEDTNFGGGYYGGGPGGPVGPNVMKCDQSGCYAMPGSQGGPPGQAIELQLFTLSGDIRVFRPFRHESGDWLDFSSPPSLAPRLVLNKEAALGFSRYQVPAEMRLSNVEGAIHSTPRFIGVIDDGIRAPTAYVRADEMLNWLPEHRIPENSGLQLMISPESTDLIAVLKARLVGAGMPDGQLFLEPIRSRESLSDGLAVTRWLFLGLASLVLLIGVAGILNVGLATVGERIEEFALRRAVGTPRLLLAGIVLAETLLTGLLTATAAIGAAVLGLRAATVVLAGRVNFPADMTFPWQAAVAGVIAGLVAGVLGGLIPAIRAARIPIATVMRA
jgi:putative ABC transport system permease protein